MTQEIADALRRAESVLQRRPSAGMHDDAPATSRWQGGLRFESSHANGMRIATDMPVELGGSGERITPGWLMRAGLAACAATSILMTAIAEGIELTTLELVASSRSDTRGVLGMTDDAGNTVDPTPRDLQLHVRIGAAASTAERLQAIVEQGCRRSPIPNALQHAVPISLRVEIA